MNNFSTIMLALALSADSPSFTSRFETALFGIYAHEAGSWNEEVSQNFPLVIIRFRPWAHRDSKILEIKQLATKNRVIVDFQFLRRESVRRGQTPPPDSTEVVRQVSELLNKLSDVDIEGITLDEENVPSFARLRYLSVIYRELKQRYPERIFLQWPSVGRRLPRTLSTMSDSNLLGTDGWIIDPYVLPKEEYEPLVSSLMKNSPRIYAIAWAAPGWQIGDGRRVSSVSDWWNQTYWQTFYTQVAVNRSYNIPTLFYLYGLESGKPVSLWQGNECDREFYRAFIAKTLPYLRDHRLPTVAPAQRPSWIPSYCS